MAKIINADIVIAYKAIREAEIVAVLDRYCMDNNLRYGDAHRTKDENFLERAISHKKDSIRKDKAEGLMTELELALSNAGLVGYYKLRLEEHK